MKSGAQGRGRFAIGGLRKSEMPVWQLVAGRSAILPCILGRRLYEERKGHRYLGGLSARPIYCACGGLLLSGAGVVLGEVVSGGVVLPGVGALGL